MSSPSWENREKFAASREMCFRTEDTWQKHGYIISSYEPLADMFFLYFNIRPNNKKTKINNQKKKKKNAARNFFVNLKLVLYWFYFCSSWEPTQKSIKTRGPRATIRSPEWHSHCRHADVMQHFSNPIIATNENIIIWAVLSFEEEYMGLTVNGAWSFE